MAVGLFTLNLPLFAHAERLDDIVRVEMIDGGMTPHGTYMAALKMTLADGWKTYWRAPGDAGIPPTFSWRGSRNIGAMSISWPVPEVFYQNGMRSIGYERQLVLPLEITPADPSRPVRLKGEMAFGICEDVCIPGSARFGHLVDPAADRHPAIVAALAAQPFSASEAGVRSAICHIRPTQSGLQIEAHVEMPPAGSVEAAVIEPGNPEIWASEPKVTRRGDTLIASSDLVHVAKGAYALNRSNVRITVLGDRHTVDIQGCAAG